MRTAVLGLAALLLVLTGAPTAAYATSLEIGGPFSLTDHNGRQRTDRDFRGRFMLVFFGYAQCRSICPVGLRRMAGALDALGAAGDAIQPILISIDPARDTPDALRASVARIHPRLIGLTGDAARINAAAKAYQVEFNQVSRTSDGAPILAHGSYIYLMRPDGSFATLIPPFLGEAQIVEILRRYIS